MERIVFGASAILQIIEFDPLLSLTQVLPLDVSTLPEVPGAIACNALVPFPNKTPLTASVAAPVPPLATAKVPVHQWLMEVQLN